MRGTLARLLALAPLLLGGVAAHADAVVPANGVSDSITSSFAGGPIEIDQGLGTGITGDVEAGSSASFHISNVSPSSSFRAYFVITQYNTETAYVNCITFQPVGCTNSGTWNTAAGSFDFSGTGDFTYEWNGTDGNLDDLTFDAGLWYSYSFVVVADTHSPDASLTGTFDGNTDQFFDHPCALYAAGDFSCGSISTAAFDLVGSYIPSIPDDHTTRVVDITPEGLIATSTSQTLLAQTYINEEDWDAKNSDWYLRFRYYKSAVPAWSGTFSYADTIIDLPITDADINSHIFSTTTPIEEIGTYNYVVQIRASSIADSVFGWLSAHNLLNIPGWNPGLIAEKSGTFTAGTTTAYQDLVNHITGTFSNFGSSASTTAPTASDCATFALDDCVKYLFIPSGENFNQYQDLWNQLQRKPPLGYFNLMRGALSTTTATTTATSTPVALAALAGTIVSPLRSALVYVLWLVLAVFILVRISRFDFHS
jgi:hypothetical protein